MLFLSSEQIFFSLAWIEEYPTCKVNLEGRWWILTEGLEGLVIFGIQVYIGITQRSFSESFGKIWRDVAEILSFEKNVMEKQEPYDH